MCVCVWGGGGVVVKFYGFKNEEIVFEKDTIYPY